MTGNYDDMLTSDMAVFCLVNRNFNLYFDDIGNFGVLRFLVLKVLESQARSVGALCFGLLHFVETFLFFLPTQVLNEWFESSSYQTVPGVPISLIVPFEPGFWVTLCRPLWDRVPEPTDRARRERHSGLERGRSQAAGAPAGAQYRQGEVAELLCLPVSVCHGINVSVISVYH